MERLNLSLIDRIFAFASYEYHHHRWPGLLEPPPPGLASLLTAHSVAVVCSASITEIACLALPLPPYTADSAAER